MNTDAELDVWRREWQSDTDTAPVNVNLRRTVERQSRLMKLHLIADTLVTVVMGGGTTIWAVRSPQPDVVLVAVATWLFLAAAWVFSLTVNRGNWTPAAMDTAAFLDLSVRRCRSVLKAIAFAAGLFCCELIFGLSWVYSHSPAAHTHGLSWLFFGSPAIDIVWGCTLAFFAAILWYRRKKRTELNTLLTLRDEMAELGQQP